MFDFIKSGTLIPFLLMLPNFVWMALPKPEPSAPGNEPVWLTVLENIGRIAILVVPIFYALDFRKPLGIPAGVVMLVALGLYYACWIRYFTGGASAELLSMPLLGIPLPMAVTPTVFLIVSAYALNSWPMLVASLFFGIFHIWVSALIL